MCLTWLWSKPLRDYPCNKKLDFEVKPLPGLNLSAWEEKLGNDLDRDFILQGIKNGFDIIDEDANISPVILPNHPSAKPHSQLFKKATKHVINEIQCGTCICCM